MYERKIPVNLDCGVYLFKEVIDGKWKLSLLYHIGHGIRRPSQLQKKLAGSTQRVLNMQLKQLEAHELVTKTVFAELPPRVEYHLTEFGETLLPVIAVMGAWGDTHQARLRRVVAQVAVSTSVAEDAL